MKKTIIGLLLLLGVTLRGCGTAHAEASHVPHWSRCVYSVQHGVITSAVCHSYAMPKHAGERVTGHRSSINWDTLRYGYYTVTRIPRFYVAPKVRPGIPAGYTEYGYAPVTGYSYGANCGDVYGITASGQIPVPGDVATGGVNDWIPFGTHIYIPALHFSGVVEDRGQGEGGFDLFVSSCSATYTVTGTYDVWIEK